MTEARTAQSALHRYGERIELVDLVDSPSRPGVCPDCGTDISGPMTAVPLPDDVSGEVTRGWHCSACRLTVVTTTGEMERRLGGWDGWRIVDVLFRDGVTRPIAVPGGRP